jgi:hypothetical protein
MTGLSLAVGIGTDAEASSWPSPPRRGRVLLSPRPAHKIQGQLGARPEDAPGDTSAAGALEDLSSYALSYRCAATDLDGATALQTRW